MLGPEPLDHQVLGYPVHLVGQPVRVAGPQRVQGPSPLLEDAECGPIGPPAFQEAGDPFEVVGLDVDRRELAARGQTDLPLAGYVVGDLADGPDGILPGQVAHDGVLLDHPHHQIRHPDLQQRRELAHVRVADDDVQAAESFGVGVRLVAGVDDRPGPRGGGGHTLPDVLGALGEAELSAAGPVEDLPGAAVDLAGDEERDQHVGDPGELALPGDQVVLVASVGVARRVGVVLEEVDVAGDALLVQAHLCRREQRFKDALAGLVVADQVDDAVALGGGVLGVGAHVEVETRPVLEEDVGRPAPVDHSPEQIPGDLVRRETPLAPERAGHAVLVLQAEDATVHAGQCRRERPVPRQPARGRAGNVLSRPGPRSGRDR